MTTLSGPASDPPRNVAETLAAFVQTRVEQNPDVRYIEIGQTGERAQSTIGEMHRRACAILSALRDRATAGRSDIVLCFESALDFVPAVWACIYGGYSCLPWHLLNIPGLDQDVQAKRQLIGQRLNDPVLVTSEGIMRRIIPRDHTQFGATICIDRDLSNGTGAALSRAFTGPAENADAEAVFLIPTSGTSATFKIAVVGHQCLLHRFLSLREHLVKRARVFFFPFDSITGMEMVYPGHDSSIHLQPGRLAAQPLDLSSLVEEFRLEALGVTSSVLARILYASEIAPRQHDLSSLKHVGLGAEMIVPDIVRRMGARFRDMGASELQTSFAYGMTETGILCQTERLGVQRAIEALEANGEPVSVGGCTAGRALRIVDDRAAALAPGMAGNIEVAADRLLFSGYRNDPALTAESFTQDGWFRTGDIGFVSKGALTITGRQKATIIVNGKKFSLELIEAPLRDMEGIRRSLAAAAAIRGDDSATDELAIFFVPRDESKDAVDRLSRTIVKDIGRQSAIPVKHLLPVHEADFPLTATGKIRRDELVRRYRSGVFTPHVMETPDASSAGRALTDTERWMTDLWTRVLRLDFAPGLDADFFELGGDSLASAELIFAVEDRFSFELSVQRFFRRPTIATLCDLVEQREAAQRSPARSTEAGYRLLHKLQTYVGSWPGERLFADSLVVAIHPTGRRPPLFWVFQESVEFQQLARHLGPEQPLFGMRSCVGILDFYSTEVVETVTNRYLWEILALPAKAPFLLGGNCQGAILALGLARRLRQIGRAPALLTLMEWNYSYGRYTESTLLLYGDRSHTAELYTSPENRAPNWRDDFPQRVVASIPGAHGQFFRDENVAELAKIILRHTSADEDCSCA